MTICKRCKDSITLSQRPWGGGCWRQRARVKNHFAIPSVKQLGCTQSPPLCPWLSSSFSLYIPQPLFLLFPSLCLFFSVSLFSQTHQSKQPLTEGNPRAGSVSNPYKMLEQRTSHFLSHALSFSLALSRSLSLSSSCSLFLSSSVSYSCALQQGIQTTLSLSLRIHTHSHALPPALFLVLSLLSPSLPQQCTPHSRQPTLLPVCVWGISKPRLRHHGAPHRLCTDPLAVE